LIFSRAKNEIEITMGMGFPLGIRIPREYRGTGTNIESIVGMEMGM